MAFARFWRQTKNAEFALYCYGAWAFDLSF